MSDKELLQDIHRQLDELRQNQPKRINGFRGFCAEKLKLNIGTAVSVAVVLISCTFKVTSKLDDIDSRITQIQ